jgi:hypothetical protein
MQPDVAAAIAPAPPPIPAPDEPATPPESATTAPSESPSPSEPPAPAPVKVSQRIARFVDGEVQEFRDGVKREVAEFRSGYAKVRDFFRRRGARSPAR